MNNELNVLIGQLKTLNGLSEDREIKQIVTIIKDLIEAINKKEMGFDK